MNYHNTGFTLIEMLVTVSILLILSLAGTEAYTGYLTQSHRLEAEMALMKGSAALEHYALQTGSYQGATLATLSLPKELERYYHMSVEITPSHYTLIADPIGSQATRDQACGTLRLTDDGERSSCFARVGSVF